MEATSAVEIVNLCVSPLKASCHCNALADFLNTSLYSYSTLFILNYCRELIRANRWRPETIVFDLKMLQKMPQQKFQVGTNGNVVGAEHLRTH